jgi:hypothetical protein
MPDAMDYEAIDGYLKSIDGSLCFYSDKLVLCFKNKNGKSDIQEFASFYDFLRAHSPEPAKDARELVEHINETVHSIPAGSMNFSCRTIDQDKAAAEMERCGHARFRDEFMPKECPYCGPDGLVRSKGGDGHTCPECGGTYEVRLASTQEPQDRGEDSHGFEQTTDAAKWARAFCYRFGGDEGLMIGWFANAIERGRDSARGQEGRNPLKQKKEE